MGLIQWNTDFACICKYFIPWTELMPVNYWYGSSNMDTHTNCTLCIMIPTTVYASVILWRYCSRDVTLASTR